MTEPKSIEEEIEEAAQRVADAWRVDAHDITFFNMTYEVAAKFGRELGRRECIEALRKFTFNDVVQGMEDPAKDIATKRGGDIVADWLSGRLKK